jgi:hypothetical protein
MSTRRDRSRRVTPDLLAFHKANALRLRQAAKRAAWRRLGAWLRSIMRRR